MKSKRISAVLFVHSTAFLLGWTIWNTPYAHFQPHPNQHNYKAFGFWVWRKFWVFSYYSVNVQRAHHLFGGIVLNEGGAEAVHMPQLWRRRPGGPCVGYHTLYIYRRSVSWLIVLYLYRHVHLIFHKKIHIIVQLGLRLKQSLSLKVLTKD